MENKSQFSLIVFLAITVIMGLIFLYLFFTSKSGRLKPRWFMFSILFLFVFLALGWFSGVEKFGQNYPSFEEYLIVQLVSLLLGAGVLIFATKRLVDTAALQPWNLFCFLLFTAFLGITGFTLVYHFVELRKFGSGGDNYWLLASAFLPFFIPFLTYRTVELRVLFEIAYQVPFNFRYYFPGGQSISADNWDNRNVLKELEFKLHRSLIKKIFSIFYRKKNKLNFVRPTISPRDKALGEVFAYSVFEANTDYQKQKQRDLIVDLTGVRFPSEKKIYWIFFLNHSGEKKLLVPSENLENNGLKDKYIIYAERRFEA